MASRWFESVAEAQRRAKKRLPASVYKALLAGSEAGVTYNDNTAAFSEIGLLPHIAGLSGSRDLTTTVMGQHLSLPVMISPFGVQAVDPEGEVPVARAAAARGTAMGLSSFSSRRLSDVVAANPATFLQVYWMGTREAMVERLENAKGDGAQGIILTLDWSWSHSRDWGSPVIPQQVDLKAMLHYMPEAIRRPGWAYRFVRGGLPDLKTPNLPGPDGQVPTFFGAYGEWMQTPPATWEDIAWLRSQWDGPFMIKGVSRPDDARRAVDTGASAISVSSHGGNNLDGVPASIRLLPGIAAAVGDQVEVVMDSGIRRGSDVVKALALGARAVMIGRAALWGLAANSQAGVENVLDILRAGIDSTIYSLGHASIHELSPDDLLVPEGFTRAPRVLV